MIQRSTTAAIADPVLDRITQPIIERFHPRRIILFGSRARGDARGDSDYDVLVELETELGDRDCRSALYAAVREIDADVNFFLRRLGKFAERLDDPGTIDYSAAREGFLLYAADGTPPGPLAPPAARIREGGEHAIPFSVWEWLRAGDEDLLELENNLASDTPSWSGACFHAQQAAEKYLKGALAAHWQEPPRTHNLSTVARKLRDAGCQLPELAAEFQLLAAYGVEVRYPRATPPPDRDEGLAAVAASRRIIEVSRQIIDAARKPGSRPKP